MYNINFNSKEVRTSRNAYTWYCMIEYFIAILVSDAFLAKLLKSTGMSDSLAGGMIFSTGMGFITVKMVL